MEESLDSVADGNKEWRQVIDEFYKGFSPQVDRAEAEMEKIEIKDEPVGEDCEKCGSPMVYKMGRYGKFMACSNFPDCRNTKAIVKKSALNVRLVKKGKSSNVNRRETVFSSAAKDILNATSYHGIVQSGGTVRNVSITWLKRKKAKRHRLNVRTVNIKKTQAKNKLYPENRVQFFC